MTSKHQKCCCGGCDGCCFPWELFDFPPVGRNLQILKWEIDAPNCATCASGGIDGCTGEFSPETTGPHDQFGPCGNCICYENDGTLINLLGVAYYDNGGVCDTTPCGLDFCFGLTCDLGNNKITGTGIDACCSGIKLLVKINGASEIAGGNAITLTGECVEEIVSGTDPTWPGCTGTGNINVYLDPISCTCDDPDTAESEFEVVFDLEQIEPVCSTVFGGGHVCAGNPDCCILADTNCFDGATLIVTVKP